MVTVVVGEEYALDLGHGDAGGAEPVFDVVGLDAGVDQDAAALVADVGAVAARAAAQRHELENTR